MQKAYSSFNKSRGSNPFMPENLLILDAFEHLERAYFSAIEKAVEKATNEYQNSVQDMASTNENWGSLGRNINVSFNKTDYSINVNLTGNDEQLSRMAELEYGNGVVGPNPILRMTIANASNELPAIISKHLP